MTYSTDLRWRAIVFHYLYSLNTKTITALLGCSERSIRNWINMFEKSGNVEPLQRRNRKTRWPQEVLSFVETYTKEHPCFYIEELQHNLKQNFPHVGNFSVSTICRALRFDLKLSRKILTKRAKESSQQEIVEYVYRLRYYYQRPDQLVFVDETSKDGRSAVRRFAWSKIGTPAIVSLSFSRGKRISTLAAVSSEGFFGWESIEGTFDRIKFHQVMITKILPHLNPYPLPRSILILDNAKIHMYQELVDSVNSVGAILVLLPPYCPQFNPIELCFSLLKRWINKNANMVFPKFPEQVMNIALRACTKVDWMRKGINANDLYPENGRGILERENTKLFQKNGDLLKLFNHCGYGPSDLRKESFDLE
jgi:transposase